MKRNPWREKHRAELDKLRRAPVPDYNARILRLLEKHGTPQQEAAERLSLACGVWVPPGTFRGWCRPTARITAPWWAWVFLRLALEGR